MDNRQEQENGGEGGCNDGEWVMSLGMISFRISYASIFRINQEDFAKTAQATGTSNCIQIPRTLNNYYANALEYLNEQIILFIFFYTRRQNKEKHNPADFRHRH